MKKFVAIVTMVLTIVGLVGCGDASSDASTGSDVVAIDADKSDGQGDLEGTEGFVLNGELKTKTNAHTGYKIGVPLWFSPECPDEYWYTHFNERVYVHLTQYNGDFGEPYAMEKIDISKHKDSTDILELLFSQFEQEMNGRATYSDDYYGGLEYEVVSTEVINGVEMSKFEGTFGDFRRGKEYGRYPFVAYGIDGCIPTLVIGYDKQFDRDKWGETLIPELDVILDNMVKTYEDGTSDYEKVEMGTKELDKLIQGSFEFENGLKVLSPEEMSSFLNGLKLSYLSHDPEVDGDRARVCFSVESTSEYKLTRDIADHLMLHWEGVEYSDFDSLERLYDGSEIVTVLSFKGAVPEEVTSHKDLNVVMSVKPSYNYLADYSVAECMQNLNNESAIVINTDEFVKPGDWVVADKGNVTKVNYELELEEEEDGYKEYILKVDAYSYGTGLSALDRSEFFTVDKEKIQSDSGSENCEITGINTSWIKFKVKEGYDFATGKEHPYYGRVYIDKAPVKVDLSSLYADVVE